jgi:outer membrane protein OmpA-like peptidoglycan-associated protein
MSGVRHGLLATAALAASGLLLGACATEDYVNQQVAAAKSQVDTVSAKVDQNAGQIQTLNGAVQDANRNAQEAAARVGSHHAAQGFAHQVISSDSSTNFATARWDLTGEDKAALTDFVRKMASDNQDVFLEIEGHGDSRGSLRYNQALGLKRAEATRNFLASQGAPLHRMSVISFGESKPLGSNETSEGQMQNRRVTINVVAN